MPNCKRHELQILAFFLMSIFLIHCGNPAKISQRQDPTPRLIEEDSSEKKEDIVPIAPKQDISEEGKNDLPDAAGNGEEGVLDLDASEEPSDAISEEPILPDEEDSTANPDESISDSLPEAPASEVNNFTQPEGPLQVESEPSRTLKLPTSTGCKGKLCTISYSMTYPKTSGNTRKSPYPLAIFSNGFMVKSKHYKSYASRLASWGYVVVLWDTNGESPFNDIRHKALSKFLSELIIESEQRNSSGTVKGLIDTNNVFLIGHSRGGKISVLAGQEDNRIVGIFGIDPVNWAPPGKSDYASAMTNMSQLSAPLAVIGSGKGASGMQACAPKKHNYEKFFEAASGPSWMMLIPDSGHMQFLDTQSGCFACFACSKGKQKDRDIREATQIAMIMWAEATTKGVDISSFLEGGWSKSIGGSLNMSFQSKQSPQ